MTDTALVPDRVKETLRFLDEHEIWHVVSRNSPATSCRDAAARRHRLGNEGIPLHDEMKSLCVVAYRDGERAPVMLHSRGSARIDMELAAQALGATRPLARMAPDELARLTGATYGTVNPFCALDLFEHLFDVDLLSRHTAPFTVMTNAGDLTWAVEFFPGDVIRAVAAAGQVTTASISGQPRRRAGMPRLGILTGNGPESGIALWESLLEHHDSATASVLSGDLGRPRVVAASVPEMGLSMEIDEREEQVESVVVEGLRELCEFGATHLAIACNTTATFGERMRTVTEPAGADLLTISEAMLEHLAAEPVERASLLAIPRVAEMGPWSGYAALADAGVVPVPATVQDQVAELGYLLKRPGQQTNDGPALNLLRNVVGHGGSTGPVIVALTEVSVLLRRHPKLRRSLWGRPVIDAIDVYGAALSTRMRAATPVPVAEGGDDVSWVVEPGTSDVV